MNYEFQGPIIKGIQLVIPSNEIAFDDEISNYNFTPQQSEKLKKIIKMLYRQLISNIMFQKLILILNIQKILKH